MTSITAKATATVWGTKNAWSLSPSADQERPSRECDVVVEISGDPKNGFHLIMSPAGYFTADHWYESEKEALDDARSLFGIGDNDWNKACAETDEIS